MSLSILSSYREAKRRITERTALIVRTYKGEVTDWCGHDLACEITANKLDIPDREVRAAVCNTQLWGDK